MNKSNQGLHVGLITFFRANYGSVIQCYALQSNVRKLGYECVVYEERYTGVYRYIHGAMRELYMQIYFLFKKEPKEIYKRYIKQIEHTNKFVSAESIQKINLFIDREIQCHSCSKGKMRRVAKNDCFAFVTGSDQVWNVSKGFINTVYFLDFALNHQKVCFAPSIGTDTIPEHLEKQLKNLISRFNYVSCREEEGTLLINQLIGKDNCISLLDPTFLLDKEDFNYLESQSTFDCTGEYIFVHFLNRPSNVAVDFIKKILKERPNAHFVVFANYYSEFDFLTNKEVFFGSPYDYVTCIDYATVVLTDSFHSTALSINLETNFFVFEREYGEMKSQISRITNILKIFDYRDRLITNSADVKNIFSYRTHSIAIKKNEENIKQIDYLKQALRECEYGCGTKR